MRRTPLNRQPTVRQSRYTIGGWFIPTHLHFQRIYEPSYRLAPQKPVDYNHIKSIMQGSVVQQITELMPVYDPLTVKQFVDYLSSDIRFRIEIQGYDRMRTVVIANVLEKAYQGINWRVATLFDTTLDRYTSYQHETATFTVNVLVALVYWD